jgi:hypothetical protein
MKVTRPKNANYGFLDDSDGFELYKCFSYVDIEATGVAAWQIAYS